MAGCQTKGLELASQKEPLCEHSTQNWPLVSYKPWKCWRGFLRVPDTDLDAEVLTGIELAESVAEGLREWREEQQ